MKASVSVPSLLVIVSGLTILLAQVASAQYKAPSQYFRKDSPGVNRPGAPGAPGSPSAPGTAPGTAPARPAAPEKPKFKDVTVNAQFYFLNDTNRAFPWTKVTATTAKNAQGVTRTIPSETLIHR